jgi:hypothetical protein
MNLIYDFRVAPNSFDVATFLANGYLFSRLRGSRVTKVTLVQVGFRPEPSWDMAAVPSAYEENKVDTVAYALSRMLKDNPSVVICTSLDSITSFTTGNNFPVGFDPRKIPLNGFSSSSLLPCNERQTNELFKIGLDVPHIFKVDDHSADACMARWGSRYATFTIRNSALNSRRNDLAHLVDTFRSPLKEALSHLGIRLVLIPDRENLSPESTSNKFYGEDVDIEAAFSLRSRLALYSRAVINISPSTGPAILLVFSPYPYYIFGVNDETVPVMTKSFFSRKGPTFGQQRPWATPRQWTDWQDRRVFDPAIALTKVLEIVRAS